jgi:arsenite methyltransferase
MTDVSQESPRRCPLNVEGPFYTGGNCLSCGLPEIEAPDLLAPQTDKNFTTHFVKQPQTPDEIKRACKAIMSCCVNDLRYGGQDRTIISRLGNTTGYCDYVVRHGRVVSAALNIGKPDYGLDAPEVVRRFFKLGGFCIIVCFVSIFMVNYGEPWMRNIIFPSLGIGSTFLLEGSIMVWASRFGKLRLRDKLIGSIPWRGDEMVLDVVCGHGLLLIAAAKKLRSGKAAGIDLWKNEDQANNSREATWRNVQLENVADKVELKDGDAQKLEFLDGTFDVVVSSWALHNIYNQVGRAAAVPEIVRVLKPGGRLAIADIRHTREYAQVLADCGMLDIQRSWPNFLFVIPTFRLTATKK